MGIRRKTMETDRIICCGVFEDELLDIWSLLFLESGKDMNRCKLYGKLFLSTFSLSTFTFGGGYVIVPLMKRKFVDRFHWLEEQEMMDLTALAQSCPGAVAVNASIIVGYRVSGILGALVSILGTVLPPLLILSVLSLFYAAFQSDPVVNAVLKGMQSGVAAVIADVVVSMGGQIAKEKSVLSWIILVGSFFASYFLEINVVWILLVCGALGVLQLLFHRKGEGNL